MGISLDELDKLLADTGQISILSLEETLLDGDECAPDDGLGLSDDRDPAQNAEMEARKSLLAAAISALPDKERLVIGLYYSEGLTFKEIAKVLGVTESRICQLHSKAVARLNAKLAAHRELLLAA